MTATACGRQQNGILKTRIKFSAKFSAQREHEVIATGHMNMKVLTYQVFNKDSFHLTRCWQV